MFLVYTSLFFDTILALFDNKIFKFYLFRDLQSATYNCPWLNTGDGKNTPTLLYDCP